MSNDAIGGGGDALFNFEALADAAERGEIDGVAAGDLRAAGDAPKPEQDPIPEVPETTPEAAAAEPARGNVIKTPDGKHEIPAKELTETRRRNAELREANTALTNNVVELSNRLEQLAARQAVAPVGSHEAAAVAEELGELQADLVAIDAGMAEVDGEASWLNKALSPQTAALKAAVAAINKLSAKVNQLESGIAAGKQAEAGESVEDAIENNPIVSAWKDEAGDTFNEAIAVDNMLRNHPVWSAKPYAERFAEVQRRVIAVLGPECVPEHLREIASTGGKKDSPPAIDPKAAIAAGQAKLKGMQAGIQTLSDLPGGTPAAASIATELEGDEVSVSRLEAHYQKMAPDDLMQVFRT